HVHAKAGRTSPKTEEVWQVLVEHLDRGLLLKRRETGGSCMRVTWRKWRRPESHDSITHIFVNNDVTVTDRGRYCSQVVVQQIDDSGSRKLLAYRGEARDVREENGDDLPLGMVDVRRRGSDQVGHDARIDELTKGIFYSLPAADFLDHTIERGSELPDLIIS